MFPQANWRILALVLMTALPFAALGADEDARAKQLDAILAKAVTSGQPGLAVLVKKEGTVLFEKGYGLRRIKARAPITPHTDFRLASVTKQFTAMSVMLLERDGKLRYESTLTEIFPDFPAYGKAITIRYLLTHTSGHSGLPERK